MRESSDRSADDPPEVAAEGSARDAAGVSRRDLLRLGFRGAGGLTLAGLVDVPAMRAATGLEALGRQRVHDLVQLLLVRVRDDRRRPRRQAHHDGGRLRPHRQSRLAVRQRHLDVRDARLSQAPDDPLYRAPGSDHWEESRWKDAVERIAQKIRKARDETWIATEKVGDRGGSGQPDRRDRPSWAARRTRTRSATSSRRRPGCSAWPTSSTRPDFDTAPRSPVWGQRSVGGR